MRQHVNAFALILVSAAGISTVGCTSTGVEYDRMTGTAFPQAQTVGGATVTLSSIYSAEGYLLTVAEDQTNIAALTGPNNPNDPNQYDYITEAELDTLERANRASPVDRSTYICFNMGIVPSYCTQYHIWGIVVNHFYEDNDGVRDKSTMGIMWATNNRRAFANFYRNTTVSGNAGKYLRSTAHEIGHAFNLHHQDANGTTDLMNQTGVVGNTYVYDFVAAASTNHLSDHDKACVWPGQSTFAATHTNHTNHGYNVGTCP